MACYRCAGGNFHFPYPLVELAPFEIDDGAAEEAVSFVSSSCPGNEYPKLISRTEGWVGNAQRSVEVYDTSQGILLKVAGSRDLFIAPHGESISKQNPREEFNQLDREVILGPALVLALALREVWSLHASAAMYKENVIVFLGESGQGKSTLAAYLSQNTNWQLVADDILPINLNASGASIFPHFPQLKLPTNAQPGIDLPENLPLKYICVLTHAEPGEMPDLQKISTAQTVQSLLSHTAGTRMFNPALLAKHLEFSTQAAKQIPAYQLIHPHRRDTLPLIKEFLEKIC